MEKKTRSLSERMDAMEQQIARMLFGVNSRLEQDGSRLSNLEEIAEALTTLNGKQQVAELIQQLRNTRAREKAEAEKKLLEQGVADGYIISAEKVGTNTLLVGRYLDKDGKVVEPGRTQVAYKGVDPRFQQLLLEKTAGEKIDIGEGNSFELLEIYSVDDEKFLQVQEEKRRAAAQEAMDRAAAAAAKDEANDGQPAVEDPAVEEAAAEQGELI